MIEREGEKITIKGKDGRVVMTDVRGSIKEAANVRRMYQRAVEHDKVTMEKQAAKS